MKPDIFKISDIKKGEQVEPKKLRFVTILRTMHKKEM